MSQDSRYHVGYNVGRCIKSWNLDTATNDLKQAKARLLALRAIGHDAYIVDTVSGRAVPEEMVGNY